MAAEPEHTAVPKPPRPVHPSAPSAAERSWRRAVLALLVLVALAAGATLIWSARAANAEREREQTAQVRVLLAELASDAVAIQGTTGTFPREIAELGPTVRMHIANAHAEAYFGTRGAEDVVCVVPPGETRFMVWSRGTILENEEYCSL